MLTHYQAHLGFCSILASYGKKRKRLGIEPSNAAFRRRPSDLKSERATRPHSLPSKVKLFSSSNFHRFRKATGPAEIGRLLMLLPFQPLSTSRENHQSPHSLTCVDVSGCTVEHVFNLPYKLPCVSLLSRKIDVFPQVLVSSPLSSVCTVPTSPQSTFSLNVGSTRVLPLVSYAF